MGQHSILLYGGETMRRLLIGLVLDSRGQGMVEYGLIISLIILAVIGAVEIFGLRVGDLFDHISDKASEAL